MKPKLPNMNPAQSEALKAMKNAMMGGKLSGGEANVVRNEVIRILGTDVPKALKKGMTIEEKITKLHGDKIFMKFAHAAGISDDEIRGYVEGAAQDYERRLSEVVKHEHTTGKKLGRNDPCICGSGKKFKKCCGA